MLGKIKKQTNITEVREKNLRRRFSSITKINLTTIFSRNYRN